MRLVRKIILHAGYEFIGAENGINGLEVANQEQPDIILVDINLPDIDGLEVTARLKGSPLCDVPVIAITANAMVGDKEKASKQDAMGICQNRLVAKTSSRLWMSFLAQHS